MLRLGEMYIKCVSPSGDLDFQPSKTGLSNGHFKDSGPEFRSDESPKATSPEKEQLLLRIERSAHPFAALGLSVSQLQAEFVSKTWCDFMGIERRVPQNGKGC